MPKRQDSRPTVSDGDPYQRVDATVADSAQTLHLRLSEKYDGVLGPPPPWFPNGEKRAFLTARNRLLDKGGFDKGGCDPQEVRRLIAQVIAEEKTATRHPKVAINHYAFMVPPVDRQNLYTLASLWAAYKLGPVRGLKKLAGDDAAIGYRSRTGYQRRKASAVKLQVQVIGKREWAKNPTQTIKAIIALPEVMRLQHTDKTKREWLSPLDPRSPDKKQGRPRQRK